MLWFVLGLVLGTAAAVGAEDLKPIQYLHTYDGDTITVNVGGVPAVFGRKLGIRLRGVDTPELHGKCLHERVQAIVARSAVAQLLYRAHVVELKDVTRDKYFRVLATVWADGVNVNEYLVKHGYARAYTGGKRSSWCDEK